MVDANMRRLRQKDAKPKLERPARLRELPYSRLTLIWLEGICAMDGPFLPHHVPEDP